MYFILNCIAIIYIILLFRKKYPVSLSMYWLVIFYVIYIFLPMVRGNITILSNINQSVVDEITIYTFQGLISFVLANSIFLFKQEKEEINELERQFTFTHSTIRVIFLYLIIATIILLFYALGIKGIIELFTVGSDEVWLNPKYDGIMATFAELGLFFVGIVGTIYVLSSETNAQKKKAFFIFFLVLLGISVVVYARRFVIYPLFGLVFYWLTNKTNKAKLLAFGLVLLPSFFLVMFLMGYFRTFGITNTSLGSMVENFKENNFIDIFISNTDFSFSYYYLTRQLEVGNIFVGPLGYFKAFFAIIPRSIWESKPNYTSVEIMQQIDYAKVMGGFSAATGYMGEALASFGKVGVIIISSLWGLACGFMDRKYQRILNLKKKWLNKNKHEYGFTLYEFIYVFTGMLLITESHRGDFGAALLDFVLEIISIALFLNIFQRIQKKLVKKGIKRFDNNVL